MTAKHIDGADIQRLHDELLLARKLQEGRLEERGAQRLMERLIEALHRERRS